MIFHSSYSEWTTFTLPCFRLTWNGAITSETQSGPTPEFQSWHPIWTQLALLKWLKLCQRCYFYGRRPLLLLNSCLNYAMAFFLIKSIEIFCAILILKMYMYSVENIVIFVAQGVHSYSQALLAGRLEEVCYRK